MSKKPTKPKQLREAHPSVNPLDSKPIKNPLAGANAKPTKGNSFAADLNVGPGISSHTTPKSKYAFPTTRIGLVYRSLEDGCNLIENSAKLRKMIERELDDEEECEE